MCDSNPLVIQDRPQHAYDLDQFSLGAGDSTDIFVGRRCFIAELIGVTVVVPDARHLSLQFTCGDTAAGRGSTHQPACAMGTRAKSLSAASSLHVKACRAHR